MENTSQKTLEWLKKSYDQARSRNGLQKKQIAEACQVSEQAVNKWFKTGNIAKKHFPTLIKLLQSAPQWMQSNSNNQLNGSIDIQHIKESNANYNGDNFTNIGTINTPYKRVPVIGMAKLGDQGFFEEQQYPVGHGDGYIDHPTKDPNAYALKTVGDSMHPTIRHGWFVIIEPNLEFYSNMIALVKTTDGRKMIKEVSKCDDGFYTLFSVNTQHERITLHQNEIIDIQPVGGIIPPNKVVHP